MDKISAKNPFSPRHAAFTLVELLVVVACVGLVAGILFPSIQDALGQSRQAVCLARLHDIGQANLVYSADDWSMAAIPVHALQTQQDPNNPTFIGAYEWGGKSGVGRPDFTGFPYVHGSKYGTLAGFGPATRPLNRILYPFGFRDHGSLTNPPHNRMGAESDTRLELDAFRCPADDRPPLAAHCPDWINNARQSSFDHFGTSYAANIFMISEGLGGSTMMSNSPYLRPMDQVSNPAQTIAFEENIGRWAWAARREPDECLWIGEGIDPGPTKAIQGWHGKDWTYNRVFIDGHSARQTIYIEGTEDREGYANHYRTEELSEYPSYGCGQPHSGSFESLRCVTVRGDGWQKDTLPAPPVCTGLTYNGFNRPSYEDCVQSN